MMQKMDVRMIGIELWKRQEMGAKRPQKTWGTKATHRIKIWSQRGKPGNAKDRNDRRWK